MNPNLFAILPSEIIIDILSRLLVGSVISCKCVCKSWVELLGTHEFVKSHLSKSVPGIAMCVYSKESFTRCGIVEFIDSEHHNFYSNVRLWFPNSSQYKLCIHGSADGLLLLLQGGCMDKCLFLCNPITREYIQLYSHEFLNSHSQVFSFGFGKSKVSGKYKAIILTKTLSGVPKFECRAYTIGTGSWRIIESSTDVLVDYNKCHDNRGTFFNGNLHWLARDVKCSPLISCFNLEIELFSAFSLPPRASSIETRYKCLSAMEDCLCLCLNTITNDETVIWSMNEYGVEKSWTKKFVITGLPGFYGTQVAVPFKVFKNGDVLLSLNSYFAYLHYYSNKNRNNWGIDVSGVPHYINPILHIPSFLSLKSFLMENTISY